jgi:hypothetical protein
MSHSNVGIHAEALGGSADPLLVRLCIREALEDVRSSDDHSYLKCKAPKFRFPVVRLCKEDFSAANSKISASRGFIFKRLEACRICKIHP